MAILLSVLGTICVCTSAMIKGKDMRLILLLVFSANVLIAVSYLLTGAYNGAASCFVGGVQAIINYFFERKGKKLPAWLLGLYALSVIVVNLLVFSRLWDLLAMFGSLTFILCITQKNGKMYRLWSLIKDFLWLAYALVSASWGPLISQSITLSTVIGGMLLHDRKEK